MNYLFPSLPPSVPSSLFLSLLSSSSLPFFSFLSPELGIESRASHMLDKCAPTELQPSIVVMTVMGTSPCCSLASVRRLFPHQFRMFFYTENMFWLHCSEKNFYLEGTSNLGYYVFLALFNDFLSFSVSSCELNPACLFSFLHNCSPPPVPYTLIPLVSVYRRENRNAKVG